MNFTDLLSRFSSSESRSLENANPNRVRYNVYDPEGEKALILFERAVALMKDRSERNPGDPLGWDYQAGIHGIWNLNYSNPNADFSSREQLADFAEEYGFDTKNNVLNGNTVLNNCTHFEYMWNGELGGRVIVNTSRSSASSANFIAWHRLYLQYFEEIVRENLRLSGEEEAESWALPYWAYLNEGEFVMPELLRKSDSSLYTPYRNPQLNAGIPLTEITNLPDWLPHPNTWPENTPRGLYQNTYLSMGTVIENMPHNMFHVASGWNGALFPGDEPEGDGLMLSPSAAAFDPVFWIHHSFIDKIWSTYNHSENAFYGSEYFFDKNPWNYMFLAPSRNGELQKEVISYWGNNSANVVSKIYNPDYSYDYIGTIVNPENLPGPNKVLSLIQSPAFRPTLPTVTWSKRPEQNGETYFSAIPLTINKAPLTAGNYLNLTNPETQDNPFDFVSEVRLLLSSSNYARFILTTEANLPKILDETVTTPGLRVQGLPMGMNMPMPMTPVIDFGYSDYSYVPPSSANDDPLVLLMITDSEDARVNSVATSLNQNLNKDSSGDSTFDAAAYFAQFPKLLTNSEATADPQAYYEKHDKHRGIVAPEINFRAAATGMAYLMENIDLVVDGISASPYSAISHYLDDGQKQGLSLGDSALISTPRYLHNNSSGGTVIDFSSLKPGQKLFADIIVGKESSANPVVGFYHVVDKKGSIVVDGVTYKPGDADYGRLATSKANVFDPLTGLNANDDLAEHKLGVKFKRSSGLLAPFAVVKKHTFFGFADANPGKISHFRINGNNILGLESSLRAGNTDFDDTLIGFRFGSPTPTVVGQGSLSKSLMPHLDNMLA